MWPNSQFPADLFTFSEEILNGKLNFLCSESTNVLVHWRERHEDFSIFWESVMRKRKGLRKLVVVWSDVYPELCDDGILSQTDNTTHFLGLEHVQKNVEEFSKRFPFPINVSGGVGEDIFDETGLIECESK